MRKILVSCSLPSAGRYGLPLTAESLFDVSPLLDRLLVAPSNSVALHTNACVLTPLFFFLNLCRGKGVREISLSNSSLSAN